MTGIPGGEVGTLDFPTAAALAQWGRRLGTWLQAGDVVLLSGPLGAGKTWLAKAITGGVGARGPVTSPTFTLINQYPGPIPVFHCDLYRIKSPEELQELGLEEALAGEGVCLVEWPEKLDGFRPAEYLGIGLSILEQGRRVRLVARGERYERLARRALAGPPEADGKDRDGFAHPGV